MMRQAEYAVTRGSEYLYVPTPKQTVWHEAVYDRTLTRLLVGGAASPGKSKWLRETLYRLAHQVPGFHALLVRKTHKDLDQSHLVYMPYELEQRGAKWKDTDRIAVFKHPGQADAVIRCGHMEDATAIENYLSSQYDVIAPDELVTFDRDVMLELFSRARSTNEALFKLRGWADADPDLQLDGSMVLTATNPGGRGARWVKDFFIDHEPDPEEFPHYEPHKWAFFQARVTDNPYVKAGYVKTLQDMREARRRQLLDGDWNIFEGQFFDTWRETLEGKPWHVQTIGIPKGVEWFGSLDWGRASPGCMLWWACLEDGSYHIRHEWKFQGMSAEEVGPILKRMTKEHGIKKLRYIAADPSIWAKKGEGKGESIGETLLRCGLPVRKSDNDRLSGWSRVVSLLRDRGDSSPWLTFHPDCKYLRRTLPAQVSDKTDPEDVDTTGDDHGADALRYGAMSRPRPTDAKPAPPMEPGTIAWWKKYPTGKIQPTGVLA